MKIALLGGSFDPPHLAHLQVIDYLLKKRNYDQVWVIPAKQNPFKGSQTSFAHRLEMCHLAFGNLGAGVQVRADDEKLTGYTIDLVRKLTQEHPEASFTFVGGSDLKEELSQWKEAEALQQLITFEFLPRPPDPNSPFMDISSTEVRASLAGGAPPEKYLPKKVADYVKIKQLYPPPQRVQ
jgi:nicotinate-nucleotide adenylyltransferase